mmetsp:Transcript_21522/g.44898  ORF Transcript_21522/g.44898 Transcript_21522/m.44898 type:complete len:132 (-) Transcript_21522:136-531(-)
MMGTIHEGNYKGWMISIGILLSMSLMVSFNKQASFDVSDIFNPDLRNDPAWAHIPNGVTWNKMVFHVRKYTVGTSFAVRRRGTPVNRKEKETIRAYAPYAARHTDWYEDPAHKDEGKKWYLNRADPEVNHW